MNADPSYRKILIAYNTVQSTDNIENIDSISEVAVKHEVEAVREALSNLGYQLQLLSCDTVSKVVQTVQSFQPDVVFNLCEAFDHRPQLEAAVAGLWELLKLPYTGNSFRTLQLAQDKVLTKKLLLAEGIATPDFQVFIDAKESCHLSFPVIAKPAQEDGSLGITQRSVAQNEAQLRQILPVLLEKYQQPVLVEQFISGREFNISLLGNDPVQVLPISELSYAALSPDYHPIASYEAKWLEDHPLYQLTPPICPAEIDDVLHQRLEGIALRVYRAIGGRDYGRVDVRLNEEGEIYVLEYNPNPDISLEAGFVRALQAAGWSYEQFAAFLIREAWQRRSNVFHSAT